MASPGQPPPPPGEPKAKPDLNAVYNPLEDDALNAQIAADCKDDPTLELPGQQAQNEVLNVLFSSPARAEAEALPMADLLGDTPNAAVAPTDLADLLGDTPPAAATQAPSVDLLGTEAPAAPAASMNLFGDVEPASTAAPQADTETADLLSGGTQVKSTSAGPGKEEPEMDDFEKLLAAPASSAAGQTLGVNRIMSGSDQDMLKVVDMEKMAAQRAVPSHLDLSAPAPALIAPEEETGEHQLLTRVKEGAASAIAAANAMGGDRTNEDGSKPRTLSTEASEAWTKVVDFMPEQVKQYVPVPAANASNAPDPSGASASSSATAAGTGLEADHKSATINRACEGKWVPTYMRHQLAKGGHTELPQQVNGHEHRADRPPPSASATFKEMGEEVHENAQAMLTYMIAFIGSIALQCQMCSQSAATTMHEGTFDPTCGGLCGAPANGAGTANEVDEVFTALPDEASAGLGPIRSRVQRAMQGVNLETVLDIAKTKLVTRSCQGEIMSLPLAFQRLVRSRELKRQVVDRFGLVECFFANTEANVEGVPPNAVELVGLPGAHGGDLNFRERWRVDWGQRKATVEFSNEHMERSLVVVAIRLDIVDRPDLVGGPGCEVDSRLYIRPRTHGAVMPIGFVEGLTEMHHVQCESLRDAVLGLAEASATSLSWPAPPAATPGPPAQTADDEANRYVTEAATMKFPVSPEKRPCNAQERLQPQPMRPDINLDKSMQDIMLQVADGI